MFSATDDDDLDFNPSASSKLASLFNFEKSPSKGNTSLTYTAPKQPKPRSSNEDVFQSAGGPLSNKLSLILVKEIHSFKLENGSYSAHGKSGAALVGNEAARIFKLLLYKGKKQIYVTAAISPIFQYAVLPNLYASFYDNGKQNWSIVFESKEDSMEFARQVGVARFKSFSPSEETPLCQELYPGNGDKLKDGETAFLILSASLLPEDSSHSEKPEMKASFNHKLSGVGWASGLVGASPGSCRLLILPQSVEIPWLSINKKCPVLVEAHVQSKKGEKNDVTAYSSSSSNATVKGAHMSGADSAAESGCEDSSIRARGASIKEALTHSPRSSKASIISRMARMGQATLPLEGAAACNPSDSEETEEESGLLESKRPPLKARPNKLRSSSLASRQHQPSPLTNNPAVAAHSVPSSVATTMTIVPASSSLHRTTADGSILQYISSDGQLVSLNTQSASVSPSDPSPHISMFLSEARMHNTEMRMHFNKFGDKLDQLVTKVDSLQQSSIPATVSPVSTVGLEPSVLLSSIEKLVRDNQILHSEVAEKNRRLEEQNERIFSLLSANSKFLEQSSSFFEQKQQQLMNESQQQQKEELSVLVQQLRSEKDTLESKVSSLQTQLANVQGLVQSLQKCNGDLTQELENTKEQLQDKDNKPITQVVPNLSHQEEINCLSRNLEEQKELVSTLQHQIEDAQKKHLSELKTQAEKFNGVEQKCLGEISALKDQLKEQQYCSARFAESAQKFEAQYMELKKKLSGQLANGNNTNTPFSVPLNELIPEVKSLMNTLYRGLGQQFVVGKSYEAGHIKSSIASSIKEETLNFVQRLETRLSVANVNEGSSKPAESHMEHTSDKSNDEGRGRNQVSTDSVNADLNPPLDESETDLKLKLESSDMSAMSSSTEPDLPPIPQVTASDSLSENNSFASREEREPSPEGNWGQRPPPLPLFSDDDDDDEWGP